MTLEKVKELLREDIASTGSEELGDICEAKKLAIKIIERFQAIRANEVSVFTSLLQGETE